MARNFWYQVNTLIRDADLILMVLDSRIPFLSKNPEIIRKIEKAEKNIIYVLNKCDLIDLEKAKEIKKEFSHAVFVSSKMHYGATILKKKIMHFASKKEKEFNEELKRRLEENPEYMEDEFGEIYEKTHKHKKLNKKNSLTVGVLGYPNTGKSSIINMLAGRQKAKASSFSGHTKGSQLVRISEKIMMIDSPGVLPFESRTDIRQVILGSINPNGLKDVDLYAYELIKFLNEEIQTTYFGSVNENWDEEEVLNQIAKKFHFKAKGNEADIIKASSKLIIDWQKGKITALKTIKDLDALNTESL